MSLKPAQFKQQPVWIEVNEEGKPIEQNGCYIMRYRNDLSAQTYKAKSSNVTWNKATATGKKPKTAAKVKTTTSYGSANKRTQAQKALAKQAVTELIGNAPKNTTICYTDGSSIGNPGPAGSGCYIKRPNGHIIEACVALGETTNNVAELNAIKLALTTLQSCNYPCSDSIFILTDSQYSYGSLTLNWKAKSNQALIQEIKDLLQPWKNLQIYWIAGHIGTYGNEKADQLANQGAQGITETTTYRGPA